MLKDCRYQLTIEGRLKHSTLDKPFLFWTIAWIALQGLERSPKKRGPLGAAKDVRPLGARHPRRLRPDAPTPSSALLRSTCVLRSCWWMPKNCHRGSQGPRDPRPRRSGTWPPYPTETLGKWLWTIICFMETEKNILWLTRLTQFNPCFHG